MNSIFKFFLPKKAKALTGETTQVIVMSNSYEQLEIKNEWPATGASLQQMIASLFISCKGTLSIELFISVGDAEIKMAAYMLTILMQT